MDDLDVVLPADVWCPGRPGRCLPSSWIMSLLFRFTQQHPAWGAARDPFVSRSVKGGCAFLYKRQCLFGSDRLSAGCLSRQSALKQQRNLFPYVRKSEARLGFSRCRFQLFKILERVVFRVCELGKKKEVSQRYLAPAKVRLLNTPHPGWMPMLSARESSAVSSRGRERSLWLRFRRKQNEPAIPYAVGSRIAVQTGSINEAFRTNHGCYAEFAETYLRLHQD